MNRLNRAFPALVLFGVLAAGPAFAQGLAVLTGTVTDAATQKPVTDVVVTATSPSMIGEQIVVTDQTGAYRIPQLPPGTYSLRLEKESYKPYSRSDIVLRADRTIRVNIELLPEALKAEEVVVVGKAPTIDVGSSATGYTVSNDFVRNIAVSRPTGRGGAARSFESLAEVAPQAQADAFGVSLNGTTSPENGYIIDGLSVADPAFGINGSPLTAEFVQEVNVVTGGYLPEFGRSTGGVLSVSTKTGSNEFRGSVFGTFTPGSLVGQRREVAREGSALSFNSVPYNIGDFGAELGGPIIKDKLWFYAGVAPNFSRYKVSRFVNRLSLGADGQPSRDQFGFQQTERIQGSEYSLFSDTRQLQYIGKLTYALSSDHTITAQVTGTPSRGYNQDFQQLQTGPLTINLQGTREGNLYNNINDSLDALVKLNSSFLDKRLLLDATVGYHSQTIAELPVDNSEVGSSEGLAGTPGQVFNRSTGFGTDFHNILEFIDSSHPGYDNIVAACDPTIADNTYDDPNGDVPGGRLTRCPVTTWAAGGPGFIRSGDSNRWQGRGVLTYLLNAAGRHVIKAGVDADTVRYHSARAYTGRYAQVERLSGASWSISRNYGSIEGPGELLLRDKIEVTVNGVNSGVFLQDSWNIFDVITLNAGVRYDTQNIYGSDGSLGFSLPSQVSPRIGLIYDFTREGRSKIYANVARYYYSVPLNIADRAFGVEKQVFFRGRNQGCSPRLPDGTDNPDYSKENCVSPDNVDANPLASPNSPNGGYTWLSADRTAVDPNLQPMSTDELVVGGEFQVIPDGRLGVVYTKRSLVNAIEDMSYDEGASYFIGNPGRGIASPFPKATRDYDALTIFFDKTFADGWMAQASYTLSRLYGNYNGLFVASTGQIDPGSNATFDIVSLLANQTGPLEADTPQQLKLFGAKQFVLNPKMGITIGASYIGVSGVPINYLVAHPSYGADEGYLLPRGSGGRTPFIHRIDTRLAYDYKLTDANVLSLSVDVFNMFNFQGVTGVDDRFSSSTVLPIANGTPAELERRIAAGELNDEDTGAPFEESSVNPNFKNATSYQQPRNVRFGLRVTF